MTQQKKPHVHLRTILMTVNILVFLLPLVGVIFFRVYENALVQQTEGELISQAAVIAAAYTQEIAKTVENKALYGIPAHPESLEKVDEYYTPIMPRLDLSKTTVYPPREDGVIEKQADSAAIKAGHIMSPIIIESQKTTLSGIKILDYQGVVVAGQKELGQTFASLPEVERALSGFYTSVIRERISDTPTPALASISRGTGIRVFIAMPIVQEGRVWGVVYISRTPQNILKHMYAEQEKLIFVACILLGLTLIIALLTSYTISRPINQLIRKTKQFANGDTTALQTLDTAKVFEIAQLSESFANMAQALNNRADYIRNFAMHVSHEFKTPITAIQGSAELLQDHIDEMDEAKKKKFLSNIIAECDRLKRLVSRLLELARADNIKVRPDEICDLYIVLEQVKHRYNDHKKFSITLTAPHGLYAQISQDNLETICINLIDNAYQNKADTLEIDVHKADDKVTLDFKDNGCGISEANASKIFTPFFTTRRDIGGTGIGMGIISSILDAHEGKIEIINSSEGGSCFQIMLKRGQKLN